ncbi:MULTISPECIES: stage III sporulation protein SpoIIIAB [Brevibacillus]|jgi:stage III sporulation protein AB|uniref:Stage III sporulation protein AB n=1 Tax=Brevibacillus borstelensis AK1 TaxID=1300222 RepID=M8EE36_9BACL|nr:stage III sporulation protein SpoIIIAB [Brevibacillus borstelensis]EMT53745.1 stage III sporulation protein AB [Brevibacillus borstelensis AK1]KKX56844.1 stage III sporulation protein AB [Brevibacillus borstelensis cifa_chp40]MBE5394658.1 stage III sporulation protein AB [Brevibacillus borstelensis]MCC0562584.1 stage III sporulation protein AB [Brevibacillus borstelensis]MCM3469808.1 stage III sporulation protein SpoIIIAB [Brevibacillus borstelensis]
MVKLIGAVLILFSASMVGWQIGRFYAYRPVQLRALLVGLQMLETEIVYGLTPLQPALLKVGNRLPTEIGQLFQTAAGSLREERAQNADEALRLAIDRHWQQTSLRKQERDVLTSLGQVLGSSDREDQQKHLRLAVTHLRGLEEEARAEQNRYEKMYKSLGFLCGLLVVILMF